jgi:hypothetical protein
VFGFSADSAVALFAPAQVHRGSAAKLLVLFLDLMGTRVRKMIEAEKIAPEIARHFGSNGI